MTSALHEQIEEGLVNGLSAARRLDVARLALVDSVWLWSASVLHLAPVQAVFGSVLHILAGSRNFGPVWSRFYWFKVFGPDLKLFEGFETNFGALEAL